MRLNLGFVGVLVLTFISATTADARIRYLTLSDLVTQSDLVFYGETIPDPNSPYINRWVIWFKAKELLKKPPTLSEGALQVCDQTTYVDTLDVHKYPGEYVVFAKSSRHCFAPVGGYKSLIGVKDEIAETGPIDGEPNTQQLSTFLKRIRELSDPAG